jgi:eukaryotic-like serine/threonine-protein kinase
MPFSPGDKLGPYEIVALIGKGGMGEVYRGTDTRLGRPVAIKTSAREFSDRFEREARAISALNHPHICTLYDVGPNYLVMEFVEGDSLSKIIEHGPIPLDKALQYAVQIVDALAAASANPPYRVPSLAWSESAWRRSRTTAGNRLGILRRVWS